MSRELSQAQDEIARILCCAMYGDVVPDAVPDALMPPDWEYNKVKYHRAARSAITAWNRRADVSTGNVRVKPLVWDNRPGWSLAQADTGIYRCFAPNGGLHYQFDASFPTLEAAQTAAQADYEARIMAALEPDEHGDYVRHSDHLAAMQAKDARIAELEAALTALVKLNDEWAPFGGEMYQDRIERAWDAARAALQRKAGE